MEISCLNSQCQRALIELRQRWKVGLTSALQRSFLKLAPGLNVERENPPRLITREKRYPERNRTELETLTSSGQTRLSDTSDMTGLPSQYYLIGNALRNAEQTHRVVSQNIANVNTPGYQTRELSFDDYMKRVKSGDANQGLLEDTPVKFVEGLDTRVDGNNVDIDHQVANLKKNALMFQTYSQLLAAKMATMRKAIQG